MTLQSHPRSLILAPIESAYMTSYCSSVVTLVLSCRLSGYLKVTETQTDRLVGGSNGAIFDSNKFKIAAAEILVISNGHISATAHDLLI